MSHIVTIKTQLRDPAALAAACRRLGHTEPVQGTAQLYSESAAGWIVQLPGWLYPVVVQPETGEAHYDNYNGAWVQDTFGALPLTGDFGPKINA